MEDGVPEAPDPTLLPRLEALAAKVRSASRAAGVVRLDDIWTGTEEEFLEAVRTEGLSGFDDIALIRDAGRTYVYSSRRMTGEYALLAARADADDLRHAVAETVRSDSIIYPRPTPIEFFYGAPYFFSPEAVDAAVDGIAGDPQYADICQLRASNGALFLYSSDHMQSAYAQSLAEWAAVERHQNW
jgi:hypothetical protein